MKNAIITLFLTLVFSLLNTLQAQEKDVDLSISEVWPITNGAGLNYSFSDQTHPYIGGYKMMPHYVFNGFSETALPVTHPGNEEIIFDWQMQLIQNPEGAASIVFNQTKNITLSTGDNDTIFFGSIINANALASYRLQATLSSNNDPVATNNEAVFEFTLTDSIFGFIDTADINNTYTIHDDTLANSGDGIGIVLDFPDPGADTLTVKSLTAYISDEYTGVVANGNGRLYAVLYSKDEGTGLWNFTGGVEVQSNPHILSVNELGSFVTMPFNSPFKITEEKQYLAMLHIFNGGDNTEGGKISIGSQTQFTAPADLCAVQYLNNSISYANEVPAIWINLEPKDPALNSNAVMESFSIPNQLNSTIYEASQEITVQMPSGTDLSSLVADFSLSAGATATINGTLQESGVSTNNFSNAIAYTITAEDGVTTKDWNVQVTTQNSDQAEFSAYFINGQESSSIDVNNQTIYVAMPQGTDITNLVADFIISNGATATVNNVVQESGVTPNDYTGGLNYIITAADGVTTKNWTVYIDGSSTAEANILTYRIFGQINSSINPSAKTIAVTMPMNADLTNLIAEFTLSNGATATINNIVQTSGITANDFSNIVTYAIRSEDETITNNWNVTVTTQAISATDFLSYSINGNEGIINYNSSIIRVEMPTGTDLSNLVATFEISSNTTVKVGSTTQESGVTANNFSQIVKYKITPEQGLSKYWYVQVVEIGNMNNETDFIYFGFYNQTNLADIDNTNHTISVNLDPILDITELIPMFYVSEGAVVYIDYELQWTGENIVDFSDNVTYTIVAEDGTTTQDWVVQVTTHQNASAEILSFEFTTVPDYDEFAAIYSISGAIHISVPEETEIDTLVAEFILSDGATAKIGTVTQVSGVTKNDFTSPIVYTVTSENGNVQKDWVVTVGFHTGINDQESELVNIYPNPVNDYLIVTCPSSPQLNEVTIIDINGKLIHKESFKGDQKRINLSYLSDGTYILVLKQVDKQWVTKFVK